MMGKTLSTEIAAKEIRQDYKNPGLPLEDRVVDLLDRMTLEEKVNQMLCIWGQKKSTLVDASGSFDLQGLKAQWKDGLGHIARLSDTGRGLAAREMATLANAIQRFFVQETRLGIPVIFHEECLHGLAGRDATSYPQPIGLASTFDPSLVEEVYSAIAEDARRRGAHQALTPVLDVARDPRWGRVEETFGEDPYLVTQMGRSAVRGFQGDGSFKNRTKVIATLKHFAAHGEPESGTNCGPVNVSERVLRDVFLQPFKEVILKENPLSVMASYNEIDGVPSHANEWLLRDILRSEWGWDGVVVSDYYGIAELHQRDEASTHAVSASRTEAAAIAVRAGVNMEFPDPDCYPHIIDLVRGGVISEQSVNELVRPILRSKFQLGLFENPYVNTDEIDEDLKLERDRPIALRAARQSIILLKNDRRLLPLRSDSKQTVAVIGPNADRVMLGGYSGTPRYYVSVLQGIKERLGDASVLYHEGCKITVGGSWNEDAVVFPDASEDRKSIREAVSAAGKADIVVLVLGENEQTSREAWSRTHLGDRSSLDLPGRQDELIEAVAATGKPLVGVLLHGRPNAIHLLREKAQAIVECWYLGQETGNAVAQVLFGDYSPSGKLPISVPRSAGHLPSFYNFKPSARRGYVDAESGPLYPFGFGLSYTTYRFSNVRLKKERIQAGEATEVLVDVSNTGDCPGTEVVQMYIRDTVSSVTRPIKELKGFRAVLLNPGETRTLALPITPDTLAFTDIQMRYVVEPGEFEIMVGNSSRDEDLIKVILRVGPY